MTTTPPPIPDGLHDEALDLVRNLAATAGDTDATYARLQRYCQSQKRDDAFAGLAASLLVIFTECITTPTEAGAYAETSFPNHPDRSNP